MKDFEKLLESGLLDEETTSAIKEAIDAKVNERLEESKENLREEFVRRYEHEKKVMIEAADAMFNEHLTRELTALNEEKNALIEEKVKYKRMIKENAQAIQRFAADKLKSEISELRGDRKSLAEAMVKFENFAVKKLTSELSEFHTDKRELVETKVRLIKEAKSKLDETKAEFIRRASAIAGAKLEEAVRKEIGDFRKDIAESRKNFFGRRIFEAFQAEFMASHASDGTLIKELKNAVKERDTKLAESKAMIEEKNTLLENAEAKQRLAESKLVRSRKLSELLGPLPKRQKELMSELLDKVPTAKLDESYKKHIKYVLGNKEGKVLSESKKTSQLSSTEGNKRITESVSDADLADITQLKKLAGL